MLRRTDIVHVVSMWCILHFLTWIFWESVWILAFRYLQRNFEVQNRYLDSFHSVKNLRSSSRNVFSPQNPFFQRFKSNYWFLSAYFWWRSTHCNPTPCNHHPMHVSKLCTFEDNWLPMSCNLRFLEKKGLFRFLFDSEK